MARWRIRRKRRQKHSYGESTSKSGQKEKLQEERKAPRPHRHRPHPGDVQQHHRHHRRSGRQHHLLVQRRFVGLPWFAQGHSVRGAAGGDDGGQQSFRKRFENGRSAGERPGAAAVVVVRVAAGRSCGCRFSALARGCGGGGHHRQRRPQQPPSGGEARPEHAAQLKQLPGELSCVPRPVV